MNSLRQILLCACLLVATAVSPYAASHRLTPREVRAIDFFGDCLEKRWAESADGDLSLSLAPAPDAECSAQLVFHSPLELGARGAVAFDVRSSNPRQRYAAEFTASASARDWRRTPAYRAVEQWQANRVVPAGLMEGDWIRALPAIRFTAMSAGTLHVRGIRLAPVAAATAAPAAEPSKAPSASFIDPREAAAHGIEPVIVEMEEPTLPDAPPQVEEQAIQEVERTSIKRGAIYTGMALSVLAIGITLSWLILLALRRLRRPAPLHSAPLSPLFELNARVWKSSQDKEGAVLWGGFKSITDADLAGLKTAGFNSVWLMGIWQIGPKVRHLSKRYGQDYQGSPYAIADYAPAPELGTEEEFDDLIKRAHRAGLRVLVDFVPNHKGLDSPWLNAHPEFFLHKAVSPAEEQVSDAELEQRHAGYFVYHAPAYPEAGRRVPKTLLVGYGKDPYFYPWIDTAQLDYAQPATRQKMIEVLCDLARKVDGVRCDMAMLVLKEQVKNHRHPEMPWDRFNQLMPTEFWTEAIRAARKINPSFVFIAETYWAMEGYLQQLGFDYTYNKPLYEAVCGALHSGHAEGLMNFLRLLGHDFMARSVHFIENHDEERAMNALGEDRQRAAAVLMATLPGTHLIHQGQREGRRERLPVQRAVPLQTETDNSALLDYYARLLKTAARPVLREGRIQVLYSNNPALIAYARLSAQEIALIIINASGRHEKGSVFIDPGLRLQNGVDYHLLDLFYDLKREEVRRQPTVQPVYLYRAAKILNDGIYVDLPPYDAHIFLLEKAGSVAGVSRWKGRERRLVQKQLLRVPESLPR